MAKKKKLSRIGLILKKMAVVATMKFATKAEVAAIKTADVTDVSQETAHAIWNGYVFTTTD